MIGKVDAIRKDEIMKMLYNMGFLCMIVLTALMPNRVLAGEWINQGDERLTISAGTFLAKINSTTRVDSDSLGTGSSVDLEDDLDLNQNETTFYGDVTWRFAQNHRLSVSYFQFKRSASATAKGDLQIGDDIFPAGASLSTDFKMEILPITYSYSFLKEEKYEFGGSIGLHWNTINLDVSGAGFIGDVAVHAKVEADAAAPMPLFGLFFDYHFTPKWTVKTHGEVFAIDLNDDTFSFSGTITNLRLATEYWLFNNAGLGAGMNWFKLHVDVDDNDWKGKLDYQYWGPQVYAMVRF